MATKSKEIECLEEVREKVVREDREPKGVTILS